MSGGAQLPEHVEVVDGDVWIGERVRLMGRVVIGDGARVSAGSSVRCGTGTLAVELERRAPGARIVGIDGDPEVLAMARGKARPESRIEWVEGLAESLPFEDASFERVVSSLFFHHLVPSAKHAVLLEVRRVLGPGGRLHVADFGSPQDPLMRALFRAGVQVLDGMENTRDHAAGRLPELIAAAGFHEVARGERVRTALGSVELLAATR